MKDDVVIDLDRILNVKIMMVISVDNISEIGNVPYKLQL